MPINKHKYSCIIFVLEDLILSGLLTIAGEAVAAAVNSKSQVHIIGYFYPDIDYNDFFVKHPNITFHRYNITQTNRLLVQLEKFFKIWLILFQIKCPNPIYVCYLPASFLATRLHPQSWKKTIIYHFVGFRDLEMLSVHKYLNKPYATSFSFFVNLKYQVLYQIQRTCLILSTEILTISNTAKLMISKHYRISESKVSMIYCGTDTRSFTPDIKKNIRTQLGLSKDTCLIVMIQRHDPRKGYYLFLDTLTYLKRKKIPFHALIVGKHTYFSDYIHRYVQKLDLNYQVSFLPEGTNHQSIELYNSADISVISSLDLETFGLSIVEAFACGCPVIGVPSGSIPEILSKVKSFELSSESLDAHSLSTKLYEYLILPPLIKKLIKREVRSVSQKYFSHSQTLIEYKKKFLTY